MKVVLVNVPDYNVYSKFKRPNIKNLPLGMAYIASQLERAEHDVIIIDAIADELEFSEMIFSILAHEPNVVASSSTTPIICSVLNMLREVKLQNSDIRTIIGGPHISATPFETLEKNKEFLDYVIFGEGEHTITELLDSNFTELEKIKGLGYIYKGVIKINERRELEKDLDSFAFPARHLFPFHKYVNEIRFNGDSTPHISLTSSRGCAGKCTFCGSKTTWGKRVRFRSPENIISEIKQCHNDFGSTNFIFVDDTFTTNKKHVIDVCKLIIDLPFKINMFCSSRVDTICEERLEWMKKAGCYCITYGIESGDDNVLKLMGKDTDVELIKNAIALTQEKGIQTHGSFILGNFGDSKQTINKTIELAIALKLDQAQFSILVPLPGTECYNTALKLNAFRCDPTDYKNFFWYYSVVANLTNGVEDAELIEFQKRAYERMKKC